MDKELIKQARQANLINYLLNRNEDIKKVGNRYIHQEHDSLVLKDNMFYWNSRQAKGNSIDFLILFYDMSFQKAVEELTQVPKVDKREPEKKEKFKIKYSSDVKRVIAYLCQKRLIDYEIIKELFNRKLMAQDEKGNIVFKIINENNIVGAEICGTGDQKYKGIAKNSLYGYGFNLQVGIIKYLFFFESTIDLLSFYEIKKDKIKDSLLISLSGLKKNIFENMIKIHKIDIHNIFLCVDNDNAGENFINIIRSKYKEVKIYRPQENCKDWNEYLIKIKLETEKK